MMGRVGGVGGDQRDDTTRRVLLLACDILWGSDDTAVAAAAHCETSSADVICIRVYYILVLCIYLYINATHGN